ncbi:MAG: S-layer homology domain-containing protein, partial [Candidatus Gracilibacteria bacterium]
VNAAEINASAYSAAEKFTDVKATDWFNETIGAAADMKVIFGYSDGTFGPNNPITRGEAAVILTRYLYYASQ